MFKVSTMISLLSLSPSYSNSPAAAHFSIYFHSHISLLVRTKTKFKPLKNSKFIPATYMINSLANYAKRSNYSQSGGLCTEGSSSGEIHVIVGPMFAGKTTTILRRMKSESSSGRNVAIIKSNKDTRYGLDSIVTHDGEKLPCLPLANLSSMLKFMIRSRFGSVLDVIPIADSVTNRSMQGLW